MAERAKDTDGCEMFEEHEWNALMLWIDSLTLSEVEQLKKYWEEFMRPKQ